MAGDWIKWEKGLIRKMEVLQLAARLHVAPAHAAGLLMQLMEWVDENVRGFDEHGNASVTLGALLSSALDVTVATPGFVSAMKEVGWIEEKDGYLVFIHVGVHNGQTAKDRALGRKRTAKHREKRKCNAASVTPSSLLFSGSDKGSVRGNGVPTIEDWTAECLVKYQDWKKPDAENAWHHYESNGWRVGKNPMKRWKSCVHTCHQFWLENRCKPNGSLPAFKDPYRPA